MIAVKVEGSEQITGLWEDVLKPTISDSMRTELPEGLYGYYYESLLNGKFVAWVVTPDDKRDEVYACLIASTVHDPVVNANTLLICFTKMFARVDTSVWVKTKDTLIDYARAANCITVTGYINRAGFVDALVSKLGATANYTLLTIPVKKDIPKLGALNVV